MFTPRYSWTIPKVGAKHQSIKSLLLMYKILIKVNIYLPFLLLVVLITWINIIFVCAHFYLYICFKNWKSLILIIVLYVNLFWCGKFLFLNIISMKCDSKPDQYPYCWVKKRTCMVTKSLFNKRQRHVSC